MKKAKVITALALTLVMLAAMTGIAAADYTGVHGIVTKEGTGVNGATVTAYISESDQTTVGQGVTAYNVVHGDGYYAFGLVSTVSEPPYMHAETDDAVGYAQSAEDTTYISTATIIIIYKGDVDMDIPEFATIAMPVAAILGLLFFFNHRKHKEE